MLGGTNPSGRHCSDWYTAYLCHLCIRV